MAAARECGVHLIAAGHYATETFGVRRLGEHLAEIGDALGKSVKTYNKAIGALESGVLPAARRFRDLGAATGAEIPEILPIEQGLRALRAEDPHTAREADSA